MEPMRAVAAAAADPTAAPARRPVTRGEAAAGPPPAEEPAERTADAAALVERLARVDPPEAQVAVVPADRQAVAEVVPAVRPEPWEHAADKFAVCRTSVADPRNVRGA